MDTETALQQVEEILKPWTRWSKRLQPEIIEVSVSRANLIACVEALKEAHWGYLSAITGLHLPGVENKTTEEKQWTRLSTEENIHSQPASLGESFLVLYHFCEGAAVLNLRVHPPSVEDAKVPSVYAYYPAASLYERELQEMFGIPVEGTPNPARFLLPEDWPDGVYPLRKTFTGLPESPDA